MSRARVLLAVLLVGALLALPGPVDAQGFGKNKVQYKDFDWRIYRSPHFDLYYYEGEEGLLQKVVSFAETAYDQLSTDFNYRIEDPIPLIIYETHSAFEQNNIIVNFIPEGIGAFASPVRNRMVMPVDLPDPELMELMLHELTHIFQYHILFQGSLGKGAAAVPPTWFMEGMASFYAKDESARDKMYLRDAVVNDRIPPVTQANVTGFFAYRFGHAVFEFVEERWGKDGLNDFIIESRNTLGARIGRAVERTFQMTPEDFDAEFRRWLRKQYLPELIATGEPGDFGRPFRSKVGTGIQASSPVASPSGDLVAAFATGEGDVDVVIFDGKNRKLLRNLTKGYSSKFQYLVAQELTMGRKMGRDLAFSPDGNTLAFFARQGEGRKLVLLDVLNGKIRDVIAMDLEQQLAPAWSPDGRQIALSAHRDGRFDIFLYDLSSGQLTNLTDDEVYDGAPTFSTDGSSVVFSSVIGGSAKLFRVDIAGERQREQITRGDSNDIDAIYSGDGSRIYFTSDRTGINNIFSLNLETRELRQETNAVTGCFTPGLLTTADGKEQLVFTAMWRGRFDLYLLDLADPITEPIVVVEATEEDAEPMFVEELPQFEPAIEVAVDASDSRPYKRSKFFLENASGGVGISDDQTVLGQAILTFSDYLGDRRIVAFLSSVDSFQNFDVFYINRSRRWEWQAHLFDDRDFFVTRDQTGQFQRTNAFSQTGGIFSVVYPFSLYNRFEVGVGYILRDIDFVSSAEIAAADLTLLSFIQLFPDFDLVPFFPQGLTAEELEQFFQDNLIPLFFPSGRAVVPVITPRTDDYPVIQTALVGDNVIFAPWGGHKGHRWRLGGSWAPDTDASGTLTSTMFVDFRQYVPLGRRSNLAIRLVGSASDGNFPSPVYFGGLDTIRGFDFRSIVGDQGFYANFEVRFPLVDQLAIPFIPVQSLRGVVFLDVGGAWFDEFQDFDFWDSSENRLVDGVSSYGWGVTAQLFGLDLNLDFAKRWDFKTSDSGFDSSIWIGRRF